MITAHPPFKAFSHGYGKVAALILMMILGALLPWFYLS